MEIKKLKDGQFEITEEKTSSNKRIITKEALEVMIGEYESQKKVAEEKLAYFKPILEKIKKIK